MERVWGVIKRHPLVFGGAVIIVVLWVVLRGGSQQQPPQQAAYSPYTDPNVVAAQANLAATQIQANAAQNVGLAQINAQTAQSQTEASVLGDYFNAQTQATQIQATALQNIAQINATGANTLLTTQGQNAVNLANVGLIQSVATALGNAGVTSSGVSYQTTSSDITQQAQSAQASSNYQPQFLNWFTPSASQGNSSNSSSSYSQSGGYAFQQTQNQASVGAGAFNASAVIGAENFLASIGKSTLPQNFLNGASGYQFLAPNAQLSGSYWVPTNNLTTH